MRKPSPGQSGPSQSGEAQSQHNTAAAAPAVDVAARLRQSGLRTTRQRLTLAEILFADGCDRHVTAESLFAAAAARGTRLSLATVYNCLHQFTDAGLLRIVTVDSGRAYFDTNLDSHHHFYYEKSGDLRDIPAADVSVSGLPEAPEGQRISRVDVIVRLEG